MARLLPVTLGVLCLGGLTAVYVNQRLTVLAGLFVAVPALLLVRTWPPLRKRPALAVATMLNVALLLAYFWSLDETHHVEVVVSPQGFSAAVDGDLSRLQLPHKGGDWGLQGPLLSSYRIQATGEALQSDTSSFWGRFASTFRLAGAGTAWAHLQAGSTTLLYPWSTEQSVRMKAASSAWTRNRRGELEGPGNSYVVMSDAGPSYIITADLMRPDGAQTILVGVDSHYRGYGLQLRFDQPDALWVRWQQGYVLSGIRGMRLGHLNAVAEIQRVLRVILSAYLYALLLAGLAIGAYLAIMAAFGTGMRLPLMVKLRTTLRRRGAAGAIFLGVSVLALIATSLVSTLLLERIPHVQDSVAYLFQAKMFASGAFHVAAPPLSVQSFFAEQFMPFYHGTWFSQYPPGHPLMLTLGVLLQAPWLVEPALASAGLGLIFLLGRRIYGTEVGLLAAVLGLSSPFWLFLGSSFMSHATGMFFAAAFMLCLALSEREPSRLWPFLAGLSAAMAFITRELTAVGWLLPFMLYLILFCRPMWRRYLPLVLGGLIPLAFFLVYNWAQVGSPFGSTYSAWDAHFGIGFGDHLSPLGPFTPGDGVWNVYQNLSMLSAQLFGWPYGLALAFAFLPFVLGAARRWDWLLAASFLGLAAIHAFYWAPGLMYGPRYYYEALPALLLLTSRGAFELARFPLRCSGLLRLGREPVAAAFLPLALLAVLVLFNLRFYLPAQLPLYRHYNYSSADELRAVSRAHVHHALLFVVSHPPGFWGSYGNVFFDNDPSLRGDIIYARDAGGDNRRLYRYFPGRAHYRLDGTTVTRIN